MFRSLRLTTPLLLAAVLQLAACASTPQAGPERDAEAKEFHAHPATAALYVYRAGISPLDEDSVLYIDDRLIGATLPRTYFRFDVRPGRHRLHGVGADSGSIEMDVRAGEIYFVSLKVLGGNSFLALEDPEVAREALIGCCALLENWAPGQRPLFR